jgi:type III secretion protein C
MPNTGDSQGGNQHFDEIAAAFNLIAYYDGAITYVYSGQEIQTRNLSLDPGAAARVETMAADLGLTDRSNRIRSAPGGVLAVSGVPRFIEQVEDVARIEGRGTATGGRAAAAPSEPLGFRVFHLRHAWAEDVTFSFGGEQVVVPGVASIVRSLISDMADAYSDYGSAPPRTPRGAGGRGIYAMEGVGQNGYMPAAMERGRVFPMATGDARVQADPRLNAIIVRDAESRLPFYQDLIEQLDQPPQLIEIQATIIDVNIDRLRRIGVDWGLTDASGSTLIEFGGGPQSDLGLSISTIIGNQPIFNASINALESEGAANIVSRPQVLTLSNVEAIFDDSQTFFVRVAGEREVNLFNVSSGTTLRVTPHVFTELGDAQIRLLVTIEDGRITTSTVDEIPILRNSSINTQAVILEGESLLLGGLTADSDQTRVRKIPLLGDIPGLGAAFRSTVESSERVERLFLITPRLVSMGARRPRIAPGPRPGPRGGPRPPPRGAPPPPPQPITSCAGWPCRSRTSPRSGSSGSRCARSWPPAASPVSAGDRPQRERSRRSCTRRSETTPAPSGRQAWSWEAWASSRARSPRPPARRAPRSARTRRWPASSPTTAVPAGSRWRTARSCGPTPSSPAPTRRRRSSGCSSQACSTRHSSATSATSSTGAACRAHTDRAHCVCRP